MTFYNSENRNTSLKLSIKKQWRETQIFPAKFYNTAVPSNTNIITQITVVQRCGTAQDRQCTCNVTLRHVRTTIVVVAKQ